MYIHMYIQVLKIVGMAVKKSYQTRVVVMPVVAYMTLLYIPGNHATTITYPTYDWLQIMNKIQIFVDTIATEVTN